jgi:uncharacterized protein
MIVSALWVYPLKGARGVPVEAAEVTPRGFAGDRRWMIVGADGHFLSARTHPGMLAIQATLWSDGLRVEAPGQGTLDVPTPAPDAPRRRCTVWSSTLDLPEATEARPWVEAVMGPGAALVFQPDDAHRPADAAYAPDHEVSLADGYPVLLATEASRRAVEAAAGVGLDMRRFRPNVVVEGAAEAWAEDGWGDVRLGVARFRNVKPCGRCAVTTFDPDTLVQGKEPLRTLGRLRKEGTKVLFGANLVPLGAGTVRVGDAVVIER